MHPVHVPLAEGGPPAPRGLGEVHVERLSRRRRVRVGPGRVRAFAFGRSRSTDNSNGRRFERRGRVASDRSLEASSSEPRRGGAAAQRVRVVDGEGRSRDRRTFRAASGRARLTPARGPLSSPAGKTRAIARVRSGRARRDRRGVDGACGARRGCARARARRPGPELASEAWSTPRKISDASRPACRSRMRRPPGCASAPKSYTPPSTMRMDAPASARRRAPPRGCIPRQRRRGSTCRPPRRARPRGERRKTRPGRQISRVRPRARPSRDDARGSRARERVRLGRANARGRQASARLRRRDRGRGGGLCARRAAGPATVRIAVCGARTLSTVSRVSTDFACRARSVGHVRRRFRPRATAAVSKMRSARRCAAQWATSLQISFGPSNETPPSSCPTLNREKGRESASGRHPSIAPRV